MEGERNYYTEQCLLCTLCRTRGENEISVYAIVSLFNVSSQHRNEYTQALERAWALSYNPRTIL